MSKKDEFFDIINEEIKDTQYCRECGKKLKNSGLYFGSNGPYGACCYKKLYSSGRYRTKRAKLKKVNSSNENICSMGRIKDCESCIIKDACKEYLDGK